MNNPVPDRWSVKSIGDLVTLQYGKSPKDIFNEDGEYPVIGTGGVTGFTSSYLHEGDTTVIGRKGTINKPSYAEGRFWAIDTTYFGDHYRDADPKWFYYSLNSFDLAKYNEASGVPSLNRDTLNAIQLLKPPLPEQQKIATILSSVDDVIEKTRAQIDKLKDLKTGMIQELLTKGIGSGGVQHTEFKDSPVGRIPASWGVQLLRDVCERVCVGFVGTCERHYRVTGVPMIRTGNLKDGKLDLTSVKYVTQEFHKKEKKSQLKAGDLLIARHGSHGSACLVPENLGEANCLNVVIVRPSQTVAIPLFLKYVFNSGAMKASFGAKSEGSTQSVISTTEIAKTAFPIPTLAEQRQISTALSAIDRRIKLMEKKLTNSFALKKALMQDLLTGKVRVNVTKKEKEPVVA